MKLILSHPTANNFTRAIAYRLVKENMLYEFHTSVAAFPGGLLDKLQKVGLSALQRRKFDSSLKPFTHTFPWFEIARMLSQKLGFSWLTRHERGPLSVDALYNYLDKKVASRLQKAAKHGVTGVYAYEDGALATFTQAKVLGMQCVYDLPIAYWETSRDLLATEAGRLPAWTQTLGGGVRDSEAKLLRKTRELELADLVIVPSQFVKDSLPEWAKNKKIVVAPFGTPVINSDMVAESENKANFERPLRILFAGSMGQRKGLGDLFSAVKMIDRSKIEIVAMGGLQAPMKFYRDELPNFTYEPGRPNNEVLKLMASCDIFCLPSIVEGRALVMQEAMSQGLPLIITPNTGGQDLVIEGETGFLVPIRSPQAIAEKVNWFLQNREKIPAMGKMAKLHAAKLTWDSYATQIISAINALA